MKKINYLLILVPLFIFSHLRSFQGVYLHFKNSNVSSLFRPHKDTYDWTKLSNNKKSSTPYLDKTVERKNCKSKKNTEKHFNLYYKTDLISSTDGKFTTALNNKKNINITCPPTNKPYSLINLVGASYSGTTITKTSETSWMTAGGTTNIKLSEGDYITYKVETNKSVAVGLSASDTDNNITTIENCLYTRFDNKIYIYQNNVQKLSGISYNATSVIKILIEGGIVKYFVNGNQIYQNTTSLTVSQLVVDFALYDKDSKIIDLQIYKCCLNSDADGDGVCDSDDQYPGKNDLEDVNGNGIPDLSEMTIDYVENSFDLRSGYTGITPSGTGTKKTISKNAATGWGNAGGSTNCKISDGQYIQYRVTKNMNVMVGFSKDLITSTAFGSIENSLYTRFDNYIYAYQGSINRSGIIKSYNELSVFKILYQGGRVKFFCDESLIYVASTIYSNKEDLYIDFLLNNNTSQIIDLQIFCPKNTIALKSGSGPINQQLCKNTELNTIIYSITGATSANFSNIPNGILANFDPTTNEVKISGTPTQPGTFEYAINLTGGCGTVYKSGTITVNELPPIPILTVMQPSCTSTTGSVVLSGLPESATWNLNQNGINIYSGSGTTHTITNLNSGSYTYYVNNNNNCSSNLVTANINVPETLCDYIWTGSGSAGSWSPPLPSNTSNISIIIDGTYDTGVNGGDLNVKSLVINNGGILNINGNHTVDVKNYITNNGIINIIENGSLTCNQ